MKQDLTANELNGSLKKAVIDLLYRLADDSLIIGHRNSEWTGLGPILEEDIAFASMSQDKIGHAVAFYNLLHDLGEADPDQLAYVRPPEQFRCCSLVTLSVIDADGENEAPAETHMAAQSRGHATLSNNPDRDRLVTRGNWARSLVRQFFFSEADALRLAALEESAYEPLAALARKLRGEVKYHVMHGRMMLEKLAGGTDDSCRRMRDAVDELYPHALEMFEATQWDEVLENEKIAPAEMTLCEHWRGIVEPMLARAGLRFPVDAQHIHGGRRGHHPPDLEMLLDSMRRVWKLDPTAKW